MTEGVSKSKGSGWSLADFRGDGYEKGRPKIFQVIWFAAMNLIFIKWWFPPSLRPNLLRAFGAKVGKGVFIRHRVRILWPWKLTIADHVWIGEDAWLLNLEPISIASNVCISQAAFLITGSHDRSSPTFEFDNAPISIDEGVWIAVRATILRGVTVGRGAVIGAGCLVTSDVPPESVLRAQGSRPTDR
jgi:putative colanic acid biosynthesis acetyltransferase WcaF